MIRNDSENVITNIIELHLKSFSKNHFSAFFSRDLLQKYFIKLIAINKFCFVYNDNEMQELLGYIIAGFSTGKAVSQFTQENKAYNKVHFVGEAKVSFRKGRNTI